MARANEVDERANLATTVVARHEPPQTGAAEGADAAVVAWLGGDAVARVRRSVLKQSTGRPVVQYRYTIGEGATARRATVVAKGYYRGDGAATFAAMEQLWAAGFADDRRLGIAQPLAYLSGPRLLLQTLAAGPSLYRYIDDPATGTAAVRLAGQWLAKLHTTGNGAAPHLDLRREGDRLATFEAALSLACPSAGGRIRRLTERVALDPAATDAPLVPTHGDFQPKNVHVTARRISVIDFDRFAIASPARDLGHFLAQSMTMSYVRTGSFDAIAEWNQGFLEAYTPLAPPGARFGLAASTVRSMLEILYYKLVVRPVRDASFLGAWLDECERCLSPQTT